MKVNPRMRKINSGDFMKNIIILFSKYAQDRRKYFLETDE